MLNTKNNSNYNFSNDDFSVRQLSFYEIHQPIYLVPKPLSKNDSEVG